MKIRALLLLGILAAFVGPGQVAAQQQAPMTDIGRVFRVDDTGTVVLDPVLEMQWQPPGEAGSSSVVSGSTRVSVQLNLAVWVGRPGRIYMTLPRTTGPTVRASWKTGGTLLPGSMASGDRALVYAGAITGPVIRDLIEMQLRADGALLAQPEALAFGFEIELDQ